MASIHFTITAEDKNLQKVLRDIEKGVSNTSEAVKESGDGIDDMISKMTKGAAALGLAFSGQQLVSNIAKVRGEFQQLEVAFNTMLGSQEKSTELMAQLTQTAAITPFGLQDVAGGAKQLLAYGVAAEDVNDTLIRLGDIAAGLSIPLGDLVYLYGTTMTQGRMFTQDLRQFQGRGIPLADELAKQFGVTKDKVGELVTAGKVGFEEMNQAIISLTSEGGKFGGLMEAQSKTIVGQISNLEDAIDNMFNKIGKSQEGIINTSLSVASSLVANYEKIGRVLEPLVVTYGAYRTALMLAAAAEKVKAMSLVSVTNAERLHYAWLVLSKKAQDALNLSMLKNPYALVGAAIVAMGYGVYKFITRASEAEKETERLNEQLAEINKNYEDNKAKVDELVDSLGNLDVSEGQRIRNFQELKQKYPGILEDINTENEFLKNKKELLEKINAEQLKGKQNETRNLLADTQRELESQELLKSRGQKYASQGFFVPIDDRINALTEKVNNLKAELSEPVVISYLDNISELSDVQITSMIGRITTALKSLDGAGDSAIKYITELGGEFSKGQLKTILSALEGESESRGKSDKKIGSDWVAKYKKDYEDAEKAIKDFLAKRDELTEAEFEKQLKELTDRRDEAKKKYESTDNSVKEDEKGKETATKAERALLEQKRQNAQDEINLLKDSAHRKRMQIRLDYRNELDDIQRQKEDWIKEYGALSEEQEKALNKRVEISVKKRDKSLAAIDKEENENAVKAMNDYLKEYGNYEQKRQAIIDSYAAKEEEALYAGEVNMLREQMKRELAALDDEIQGKTSVVAKLFGDMRDKSVEYIRSIISEAENMLKYVESGSFTEVGSTGKDSFGFTKEQFEVLKASPEKLAAIREEIEKLRKEADELEPPLKRIKEGFEDLFNADGDTEAFGEALANIISGVNDVVNALDFLGDSLGKISEAFGGNFLGGVSEGIGIATEAVNSAMQGAQAGAAFGPWGAAAGAAIGLIGSLSSSLSKLHDKKHERTIQKIQEQIEGLEKDYEKLGDAIEKAYSKDASRLIEQQNTLLKQQKALIQQQIKEEEEKKKTDKDRIEDWKQQIEDINKTLEENKQKAIDAIFGEDLQSAIESFADAYAEAVSSGEDKWTSVKDTVKDMMRQMVMESIKSALQSSKAIENIRKKLQEFYTDGVLSATEQDYIYKMAENVQRELDRQFGWANNLLGESSATGEQKATSGGFETMSEDTGNELNGRFTALQMAGEEIRVQMISAVNALYSLVTGSSEGNSLLADILTQHAITNAYLEDIVKYSKIMSGYGAKLDKIVEQTKNL